MQLATVYKRSEAFYLHANSQTTEGVWVAVRPFLRLPAGEPATSLGHTIIEVLHASQLGIPHPTDWDAVEYPLPELAGVKSWAMFMRSASCVSVTADGGKVMLMPNRNSGPREGYEALPEKTLELPLDCAVERVAKALNEAIALCE
jgi:hypothetical protein